MPTQFHKMHGAGNDFVLLDYRQSGESIDPALAARLADRRRGVGCDQVLVLRRSDQARFAARYEIFNADGSTAGQCGNGVRCIALYLFHRGEFGRDGHGTDPDAEAILRLQGPAGPVRIRACTDGEFECSMGEPRFAPEDIPLDAAFGSDKPGEEMELDIEGTRVTVAAVSMGNPHAVTVVENVDSAAVRELGPGIGRHPAFAEGCNAGFAQVVDRGNIRLRVYERGTGETLACGSGACAAVAVLAMRGEVGRTVNVMLPGGHLVIKWTGPGHEMTMKGPAKHVFRGTLDE